MRLNQLRVKYYYCYRGSVSSHMHFYQAVQRVCRTNNIELILVSFLKPRIYFSEKHMIRNYSSDRNRIFFSPVPIIHEFFFFLINILHSKRTIIHLKKKKLKSFKLLKKIFSKRLVLITDLEGDQILENQYLAQHNFFNQKKEGFPIKDELSELSIFDTIFVRTKFHESLLIKRHPSLKDKFKTSDLMSFSKGLMSFDPKLRAEIREKLKIENYYTITYIGNILYPWQNISKTIKIFNRLKKVSNKDLILLLLIRKEDHEGVKVFLEKNMVDSQEYILKHVSHKEIMYYLNASDLGIVLRDFHDMNRVVIPGKLLDYLACGLPVLTTNVFEALTENIQTKEYGVVLDTLDLNLLPLAQIQTLFSIKSQKRYEISQWANDNLSIDSTALPYITLIRHLSL